MPTTQNNGRLHYLLGWTLSHPNSLIVMHFQLRLCIHLCIQYYVNVSSSSLLFVTRKPNIFFFFSNKNAETNECEAHFFFVCSSLHKFVKLHVVHTELFQNIWWPTDQIIHPNQRYVLFFWNLIKRFFFAIASASALVVIYWYRLLCFGLLIEIS